MTRQLFLAGLSLLLLSGGAGAQKAPTAKLDPTGSWAVDAAHSQVGFTVTHLGVSKTRGKFTEFEAQLSADPKNLAKSSVTFTIQAKSIDTGVAARDNHLRSADFFDVEKFPTLQFVSTKVERVGAGYRATGNLTIHGITRRVVFPFTITGPVKGMQGETRAAMSARLSINRKDFGLTWNRVVEGVNAVSDKVDIELEVEGTKK